MSGGIDCERAADTHSLDTINYNTVRGTGTARRQMDGLRLSAVASVAARVRGHPCPRQPPPPRHSTPHNPSYGVGVKAAPASDYRACRRRRYKFTLRARALVCLKAIIYTFHLQYNEYRGLTLKPLFCMKLVNGPSFCG